MKNIRYFIIKQSEKKFHIHAEHPFRRIPEAQVLRIPNKKNWFALFMKIPKRKLGINEEGLVDIVNLKSDEFISGTLRRNPGYFPAYHMKKSNWVSILLDGSVLSNDILELLEISYDRCAHPIQNRPFKDQTWIIPSNPKYYDIHQEIENSPDHSLLWHQYPNFHKGDTVFIYETAPSQKIIYEGYISEEKIPCSDTNEPFSSKQNMLIKILFDDRSQEFTLSMMKEYGVGPIRGPRHLPEELVQDLRASRKNH